MNVRHQLSISGNVSVIAKDVGLKLSTPMLWSLCLNGRCSSLLVRHREQLPDVGMLWAQQNIWRGGTCFSNLAFSVLGMLWLL
jgi:hypothetical protein